MVEALLYVGDLATALIYGFGWVMLIEVLEVSFLLVMIWGFLGSYLITIGTVYGFVSYFFTDFTIIGSGLVIVAIFWTSFSYIFFTEGTIGSGILAEGW